MCLLGLKCSIGLGPASGTIQLPETEPHLNIKTTAEKDGKQSIREHKFQR